MKKILINLITIVIIAIIAIAFAITKNNPKSQKEDEEINVQKGVFEYIPPFESSSVKDVYYYSDEYFQNPGKVKNEHLRTMSLCLALSATTAIDKVDKAENVKKLLSDTGFYDISVEDINEETSKNSIGTAIAHKAIGDKELIAVSIRGSGYDLEWASNFVAGKDGDIKGFSDATNLVINRIEQYKEDYNLKKCKIWVVGYSRGGSVADLVGKYINEELEEFDTSEDDLYIYTFEAPASSVSTAIYPNIHNVINKNDIVTYLYPKNWGLSNNGVEEIIETENEKIVKKQIKITEGLRMVDVVDDQGNLEYISKQEFLEDFINWLTKKSKILDYSLTREQYVTLLEQPLSNITEICFSKASIEKKEIVYFFKEVYENLAKEENAQKLLEALPNLDNMDFDFDIEALKEIIDKNIEIVYEKSTVPLSREELETLKESIVPIMQATIPVLITSVFDGDTVLKIGNMEISGFYHLATFINCFPEMVENHYVQVNLKLVQNMDSYYN